MKDDGKNFFGKLSQNILGIKNNNDGRLCSEQLMFLKEMLVFGVNLGEGSASITGIPLKP